jgi:hypothetical protein
MSVAAEIEPPAKRFLHGTASRAMDWQVAWLSVGTSGFGDDGASPSQAES